VLLIAACRLIAAGFFIVLKGINIMAKNKVKLSIGAPPESFKHTLTILLPGNEEADLTVEYIYRTKQQFVEMADKQGEIAKARREELEKSTIKHISMSADAWAELDIYSKQQHMADYLSSGKRGKGHKSDVKEQMQREAESVLQIAKGWDLENEFNLDNLIAFEDRYPGVLLAITQGYNAALFDIRLKN
jgi:hypothetical protein